MSNIHRSLQNVTGDITVIDGDIVIQQVGKGLVVDNGDATNVRVNVVQDGGADVLQVEDV